MVLSRPAFLTLQKTYELSSSGLDEARATPKAKRKSRMLIAIALLSFSDLS